jgi:hypothetical protein
MDDPVSEDLLRLHDTQQMLQRALIQLWSREVEDKVEGTTFKHRISKIRTITNRRPSLRSRTLMITRP